MDEFGVLTEKYGLKPQGKSAPMAAAKRITNNSTSTKYGSNSNGSFGSVNSGGGGGFQNQSPSINASSFDLDSIFNGSSSLKSSSFSSPNYVDDDVFGGMSSKHSASVDDLLGGFGGGSESKRKSWYGEGKKNGSDAFDDLLSGFGNGGGGGLYNGSKVQTSRPQQSSGYSYKPTSTISADPFEIFESASTRTSKKFSDPLEEFSTLNNTHSSTNFTKPGGLRPPPKPSQVVNSNKDAVKSSGASLIDQLEDFAMGKVSKNTEKRTNIHSREVKERNNTKSGRHKEAEDVARNNQQMGDDLESFFGMSSRSTSAPRSRAQSSEPKLDAKVHNRAGPKASQRVPSGSSASVKKASVSTSFDELSSIFGAASVSGGFEEVDGESEERRLARLGRMQRTHERAARAVADMNQRDRQTQQEQEERGRIAETMDAEIKRWATGKEGNMRALLSSLHYVLWPECGWEPVSLTNMITSTAVKKVYRKATLCVHPDKVQQKGASLQQKYIAEKIFDILKEAWTKFNKEELS